LEKLHEIFNRVHDRLKRVNIENGTFEDIIRRYDSRETIFYFDPPYYKTAKYLHEMKIEDYQHLEELLTDIKGKFLLTINDHKVMRLLWKDFQIDEIEVYYSIGKQVKSRVRYKELIVSNY